MQPSMNNQQSTPQTLSDWLDHCERLHPKRIDMGLERVRAVAARMGLRFDWPTAAQHYLAIYQSLRLEAKSPARVFFGKD